MSDGCAKEQDCQWAPWCAMANKCMAIRYAVGMCVEVESPASTSAVPQGGDAAANQGGER